MNKQCMNTEKKQTNMLHKLKYINNKQLKDFSLDRLMFNVSRLAIEASIVNTLKDAIKRILFDSYKCDYTDTTSELLLISYNYNRTDHQKAWEKIKSIFTDYNEVRISDCGLKEHVFLSFKEIIKSFGVFFSLVKSLSVISNLKEKIYLAGRLTELVRLKQLLDRYNVNCKVAIIFFDGNSYENMIVQYLKKRGTKCVTMQHGQPVFHGMNTDYINQTMILNFSSDYILVTGDLSKRQFMLGGVPEQAIRVVGSLRDLYQYENKNSDLFLVFFDCPTYDFSYRDNYKMIEIAEKISEKFSKHYLIKLHPQDSADGYSKLKMKNGSILSKEMTIEDSLINAEFSILHASGAYLDCISMGVKAFCLETDFVFPLVSNNEDRFSTIQELEDKLNQWEKKDDDEKKVYLEKVVDYYMSPHNSLERYKEFVDSLLTT